MLTVRSLPVFFIHTPQLQCKSDMFLADDFALVKIRCCACDFEDAVISACGKRELVLGGLHQLPAGFVQGVISPLQVTAPSVRSAAYSRAAITRRRISALGSAGSVRDNSP